MIPIEKLKKHAKRLKREQNISHFEALDQVARNQGFNSWSLLMKRRCNHQVSRKFLLIAEETSLDNQFELSKIQADKLHINMTDFLKELIESYKTRSLKNFHEKFINIKKVLVIDEFHRIKKKPISQSDLVYIINSRLAPTVGLSLESREFYIKSDQSVVSLDLKDLLF